MESELPRKSKHKHKRRQQASVRFTPEREYQNLLDRDFKIPGIVKLVLGERTQRDLHCVVGDDITSEHQWVFVKKELIEDSLILNEESEFLPLRLDILTYPRTEFLIGYAPNELAEFDEFYLCLNENVADKIDTLVQSVRKEQESRVDRSLRKAGRGWLSLGSEGEIEDAKGEVKRALLEVELEATYPIMSPQVHFKFRRVKDARDGYAEMLQTRLHIENVVKRRISAGVQVAPFHVEDYAQTSYMFGRNASTQYFYDYEEKNLDLGVIESMKHFNSTDLDDLCEQIVINENINLYTDDYSKLVTDAKFTAIPKDFTFVESLSFKELDLTRNKKICSACFHPMLTGTVAIAYGNISANMKRHGKSRADPNEVVHQINPVLIWCTDDALNPKLVLECHRSIEVISFCPFDKNVVVGGCINGQIFVWDITNRIEKVEEVEVLTSTQRKHRVLLVSFMEWMKDIRDISRVRTAAQSNLFHSHNAPINQIWWLPSSRRINKLGKFEVVAEGEPFAMQFATSSLDGYVMFWDLLAKPVGIGGQGPRKKSYRLKFRPSGLTVDASPLKLLDRLLIPHYKLCSYNMKKTRPFFITAMSQFPLGVLYENPRPEVPLKMETRVEFKVVHRPLKDFIPQLALGSCRGYFFMAGWEGYEVNPGETVNKETTKIDYIARYHDEPVTTVSLHPSLPNIYLTVGGRVKRMVVFVESAIMEDTLLVQNASFDSIKDKLMTFKDGKDDLTDKIDFIICMGGDGTLLYASHLFQQSVPPIMAFHLGSLGFLTPFLFDNFEEQVNNVLEGNAALTLRSRLRCIVVKKNQSNMNNDKDDKGRKPPTNLLVLNEVVVDRGPSPYLSNIDLFLDGKHITSVQGDGLIVSTPTGSTAYAVAAGASMIHPSVPAIMVTPICPHSLSFRPIVVPAGVELKISVSPDSRNTSWVSFDGRNRQELLHGDSLRVTTSIYPVPSICAQDQITDWFDSLAECLHWNVRKKQKHLDELSDLTHSSSDDTLDSMEQADFDKDLLSVSQF